MKITKIIFGLVALPVLAAYTAWQLSIWSGDGRWTDTGESFAAAAVTLVIAGIFTALWEADA